MTILNYFFIGAVFIFLIDLLLGTKMIKKHPQVAKALKQGDWRLQGRIICIFIWPLAALVFFNAFFKELLKK
tara:strand:- start:141 stop:356 length:216 start_codon:yes stop_codon:yes gene_type:complete